MRYSVAGAIVLVAAFSFVLRAQDPPRPAPGPALDTLDKKVGYAIGLQLGTNFKQQGATVDVEAFARGFQDGLAGASPVLSESTLQEAVMTWQQHLQAKTQKAHAEAAKKNKADGEAFLAKNKTAEGVKVTASGLQYKVVKQGSGPKPVGTDTVSVNYEGSLIDGKVFDSSYRRGQPFVTPLGQVIRGWTEGLQLMETGSQYIFYIPAELAYGENGPPDIGPNAVLVFKIELLEVNPKPKAHAMPGMPGEAPGGR